MSVHLREDGSGTPLVLLPPAPHDGTFFDTLTPQLTGVRVLRPDYPDYGGSDAIDAPSIRAYAEALAPHIPDEAVLVGFHTGNLVAAELAKLSPPRGIVMIDIPYFDADTRAAYADKMERSARNAAFHAAFAYDPRAELRDLPCPVRVIATNGSLSELSAQAAAGMGAPLTERMDMSSPVFEAHAEEMAAEILRAVQTLGTPD
jgi:pimeloyl-ACP methyl ester carboxylesterase